MCAGLPGRESSARAPACSPRGPPRRSRSGGSSATPPTSALVGAGPFARRAAPSTGCRVAVIGAGPAGLACAGELAALGHAVTVYDERAGARRPRPLRDRAVPRAPRTAPGRDARSRAARASASCSARTIGRRSPAACSQDESTRSCSRSGWADDADAPIPGDDLAGVWESLPFIEAIKTGAPPRSGDRVAVIGGGNTAIDVAREARRLGAHDVTLLYRRTEAEMPAYPHEVARGARRRASQFHLLTSPGPLPRATERSRGSSACAMRLGEPDASGRRAPSRCPAASSRLPADTAIKAIGQQPRAEPSEWIHGLLDATVASASTPRRAQRRNPVFAAGDAINGGATVVEAVRAGQARGAHASTTTSQRTAREGDPLARASRARARRPRRSCSRLRCCARARVVQAFPEYGPERRGAPMRAYTRFDDRPIRRHDSIEEPDAVVVLEPSLATDSPTAWRGGCALPRRTPTKPVAGGAVHPGVA